MLDKPLYESLYFFKQWMASVNEIAFLVSVVMSRYKIGKKIIIIAAPVTSFTILLGSITSKASWTKSPY